MKHQKQALNRLKKAKQNDIFLTNNTFNSLRDQKNDRIESIDLGR